MTKPSKASNEPFWWALFGAGGVVSAMFLPVVVVLLGFAVPLGWVDAPDHASIHTLFSNVITRFVLFGIIVLCLFHWAHRFRFTLYDGLQLKHLEALIVALTYGGAIVTTIVAAVVLWP